MTSEILSKIKENADHILEFPQQFNGDHGHIAITVATESGHEVLLVSSERTIIEARTEKGSPYSQLVMPRWTKASLEEFLSGQSPPNPLATYQRLTEQLDDLIEFQNPTYKDVVCCWLLGTYMYTLFDAYGYLALLGPMGSGKTKLGEILEQLAFNPIRTSSITPAILYRSVEIAGCTLILDEQDALRATKVSDDRLGLLRDGYKKGGTVLRTKELARDGAPLLFNVYSPKVIITTSDMEGMLADRCIPIHMLRSVGKQGTALVTQHSDQLHAIRDELYGLALTVFQQVRRYYQDPGMAVQLNNRQRERWLPLLAIAQVLCPDQLPGLEEMAYQDIGSTILADPIDSAFLSALDGLVLKEGGAISLASSDISTKMFDISDFGYPPSPGSVGRLIKKYLGNIGRRSSANGGHRYLITRGQVDDLLRRYPIDVGRAPEPSECTEGHLV